ncbi:hypothetical protein ACXN5S_17050 [Pseudoroseicyclus sp. H15]
MSDDKPAKRFINYDALYTPPPGWRAAEPVKTGPVSRGSASLDAFFSPPPGAKDETGND